MSSGPTGANNGDTDELQQLRRLVLGLDQAELVAALGKLNDRQQRTQAVADVLTEALRRRNEQDGSVGLALGPTIEDALHSSIRRDPEPLADAIYPVIGPSVRRAINAAIMDMVESLNRAVSNQLSWAAVARRVAAWRAGMPYAEYLMLNSIAYRIEQVYVIHKDTGLLLQHVAAGDDEVSDPDMVSGMLTAIQDFIRDSFDGGSGDSALRSMRTGSRTVHIEAGRHAIAAMVVNGNPPAARISMLADAVDRLHAGWGAVLENFDGDAAPFASAGQLFQPLVMRESEVTDSSGEGKSRARLWPALLILLLGIGLLGWWQVHAWQHQQDVAALRAALDAEPGLVVTHMDSAGDPLKVVGLQDATARDPALVAEQWPSLQVQFAMTPYVVSADGLTAARLVDALSAPAGTQVNIVGKEVRIAGQVSRAWLQRAQGVVDASSSGWDLVLGEVQWQQTPAEQRLALIQAIEAERVYFDSGASALSADDLARIALLADNIRAVNAVSEQPPTIVVYGQSDFTGTVGGNRVLSEARSQAVIDALVSAGISPGQMRREGIISADESAAARNVKLVLQ